MDGHDRAGPGRDAGRRPNRKEVVTGPPARRAGACGWRLGVLALALPALAALAGAQGDTDAPVEFDAQVEQEPDRMTAEALMQAYLACDRASMAGRLGLGEVWRCSVVYETLKRRVFGGDFERLRAWSRGQPSAPPAPPAPAALSSARPAAG